ncbi:MAG: hypothetical protein KKD48_01940 [Nanoarchaeota archaeon]|nr:hypothetical protein [Nanoarchaeota archaeon]
MAELKQGIKTTEFWVMIILITIALLSMSGFITEDKALQTINLIFAIVGAFGYSVSRIILKNKIINGDDNGSTTTNPDNPESTESATTDNTTE